jgi:hypothetical protein
MMRLTDYEFTYPRILLAALVLVVGIACVVGLTTSATAFGSYNPAWDGTSDIRTLATNAGTTTEVAQSTSVYTERSPGNTTAFILSPTESYSQSNTDRIREFLARGGTLVVASDFNQQANPLLADLNVSARIDGRPLRDERHYYRSPALPVATNIANSSVTANVSLLTLNHASVITPGANSTILANTSGFAYLDTNGNSALDDAESLRKRPVIVEESAGEGRVIVVSDPSLFINAMLDTPDNTELARNLVTGSETVVFDYSHRQGIPWAVAVVLTIRETPLLQFLVIAVLTGLAVGAWRTDRVGIPLSYPWQTADHVSNQSSGVSRETVVERVTAQHPEWERERVERVARGIMPDESNGSDND